ncbi:MAG TPA: 16S rRNA (cytosine(967)-C(5))-methyltransferase RsmB [Burkholderiaceae bacterium]|nr:16S rRNA (cytosine(967)-C(5))-methyltransferase RsmB [Burkholderiaceae bacterium]
MLEPGGAAPPLATVLQLAARVWARVAEGQSLDRALAAQVAGAPQLRGAVQDASYGAIRRRALCEGAIAELAARPPAAEVRALLAVALAQLIAGRYAPHTVVDQAVVAARSGPSTAGAAGFVNAVLRNFLRRQAELVDRLQGRDEVRYNAPRWWIDAMRAAQPDQWRSVLESGQRTPALVLRVNRRRIDVRGYLQRLQDLDMAATQVGRMAVWLHQPVPVARIPGFADGEVSVQDAGAQLAAEWLDIADGLRVLDACAAPGGKTAHLTELANLDLTALEVDADRARRIEDNLVRIGTNARICVGDGRTPANWWDRRPFDRILLDAPCTASGIVSRHPDIPWLRRPADVAHLATVQAELLEALWPLLGVGGRLLYVVCSVYPQEGSEQVARFIGSHPEAVLDPLPGGLTAVQLLPATGPAAAWDGQRSTPTLHDGFFYARFKKSR